MMFVNVTSVHISATLTLFFCSWGVFISTAVSHPAQEELASTTWFSFVKQMLEVPRSLPSVLAFPIIYLLHP